MLTQLLTVEARWFSLSVATTGTRFPVTYISYPCFADLSLNRVLDCGQWLLIAF